MAGSLIKHGKIRTTTAKAKALRPYVERLVTKARQPTLATRRYLFDRLQQPDAVDKLLKTIGPKYLERRGGYTRIIKLTSRRGDRSDQAVIEFV